MKLLKLTDDNTFWDHIQYIATRTSGLRKALMDVVQRLELPGNSLDITQHRMVENAQALLAQLENPRTRTQPRDECDPTKA